MLRWKSEDDGLPTNLDVINRVISVQPIHLMHFFTFPQCIFVHRKQKFQFTEHKRKESPTNVIHIAGSTFDFILEYV